MREGNRAWRGLICCTLMAAMIGTAVPALGVTVGFEEFGQPPYELGPASYWNGADGSGGFTSGGASFNNNYVDYGGGYYAWGGWSVSNMTDTTTPGYDNQYSAYVGSGAEGSEFYGVGFVDTFTPTIPTIELPAGAQLESVRITNTTYAALSMLNGDFVGKQFGGATGNDPDWFRLTIRGLDDAEEVVGEVEFYLADYRFDNNELDYIVDTWTEVDLSGLVGSRELQFTLNSSDVGDYGMNTPAYFGLDELTFVPEPAAAWLALVVVLCGRRGR